MSEALSESARFEDHFGPVVPDGAESAIRTSSPGPQRAERRRDVVEHMRRCVINATLTTERATKIELWASYRAARAEAIALLADPVPDLADTPRLRSV